MIVQLGYITKRVNSTKNSTSFTSYQGTLKEACNVLSPAIEFDFGNAPPTGYNYMYIPDFRRFYWVTWEFTGSAHWTAHGKVDVLASAKAEIGTSSKYILRAASEEDENIIDTKYPALITGSSDSSAQNPTDFVSNPATEGTYIIGVVGDFSIPYSGKTGITYYAMDAGVFQDLMNYIFTDHSMPTSRDWMNFNFDIDFTSTRQNLPWKLMVNPLQYITTALWLPFTGVSYGAVSPISFAWFTTTVSAPIVSNAIKYFIYNVDCSNLFNAPSKKKWEFYEPWSEYYINIPFFGMQKITAADIVGYGASGYSLGIEYKVDVRTGAAICRITGAKGAVCKLSGQIGASLALGGAKKDYGALIGGVASTISGAVSTGMLAASGNPQAVMSGLETIRNGVNTALTTCQPVVSTCGSAGGVADVGDAIFVYRKSMDCAEKNPAEFGAPLCKMKTIASLSGFVQCADGDIESSLTDGEQLEIARYLTEGFFYE